MPTRLLSDVLTFRLCYEPRRPLVTCSPGRASKASAAFAGGWCLQTGSGWGAPAPGSFLSEEIFPEATPGFPGLFSAAAGRPGPAGKGGHDCSGRWTEPESPLGGHVHIGNQLGSWPLSQISTAQANAHASGDQEDAETEE